MEKVYHLEDDQQLQRMLKEVYSGLGYTAVIFTTMAELRAQLMEDKTAGQQSSPSLIVLDGETPDSRPAKTHRLDAARQMVQLLDVLELDTPVIVYSDQINASTPWRPEDVPTANPDRLVIGTGKSSGLDAFEGAVEMLLPLAS